MAEGRLLELVSKPSGADENAGEVDKALVNEAEVFAAEATDPRNNAFNLPAAVVAAKHAPSWAAGRTLPLKGLDTATPDRAQV